MNTNYLYIARAQSDPKAKKYNVYKVGNSTQPLERIRSLGGSGSTETFEPILIVALPRYVKDLHILAHRCIQQFIVSRHESLRAKYVSIFGPGHAKGIRRRREIVMFGPRYPVSKIKDLFRRVVDTISSQTGRYLCADENCVSTGGASDCAVCAKFTTSLLNCIAYQKGMRHKSTLQRRLRVLEAVEAQLGQIISNKNKQPQWKGPTVGDFWILTDPRERFRIIRVLSNNTRKRSSVVQEWSHSGVCTSILRTLQSRFTPTEDQEKQRLEWDQNGWRCVVQMKHFKAFCRVSNVSDIHYVTQQ